MPSLNRNNVQEFEISLMTDNSSVMGTSLYSDSNEIDVDMYASGEGISNTIIEYQTTRTNQYDPSGTWSTEFPTNIAQGDYLWIRNTYIYTNGDSKISYSGGYFAKDALINGENILNIIAGNDSIVVTKTGTNLAISYNNANHYVTETDLSNETTARQNADTNLQNTKANISETGSSISATIDTSTYVMTLSLKDKNNNVLNTQTIDLPLETMVVNGTYDSTNKKIILTLQNGNTIDIPVGDLVSGLQTEITSNNKLSSDLVDDTNNTNLFVTSNEKTTWNNKIDSSALTNYVENTDYASNSTGGVVKISSTYATNVSSDGYLSSREKTYTDYGTSSNVMFISKGTLENVITGKDLTSKTYVDNQDLLLQIQYSTMPVASVDNLGKIVQYTGTTDVNYTNGLFYKVISETENNVTTYSWKAIDVQRNLVTLDYGSSTWDEFLEGWQRNAIVFCRAANGTNPEGASKRRYAFLGYMDDNTNPTYAQFIYFRSVNKNISAQTDEVWVYTLDNTSTWSYVVKKVAPTVGSENGIVTSFDVTNMITTLSLSDNFLNNFAAIYDNTSTYAVGAYVIYNDLLYVCTTAVTSAENFDNSKWSRIAVTQISGGGGGGPTYTAGDHIQISSNNVISAIIPDEVVVSTTQPTGNDWRIWINEDVDTSATEITNSYSTSSGIGYSANYFNSKVLTKDNTTSFTPTGDYQPATKKYVDDNTGIGMIPVNPVNTSSYNIWIETD